MQRKKIIIAILLLFTLASVPNHLLAKIYPQHEFGISASQITGSGLSWYYRPDNDFAIMITGGAYYMGEDPRRDSEFYANIGASYMRDLIDFNSSVLYLFVGASYWHLEELIPETVIIQDRLIETRIVHKNKFFTLGAGLGYKLDLGRRVSISAELGLMYQSADKVNDHFTNLIDRSRGADDTFFGVGGSISLRYRF